MMKKKFSIGFMQGRLSKIVDNKIQSFPWESWEEEFRLAKSINQTRDCITPRFR